MGIGTYDLKHMMIVLGNIILEGFAEGESITIEEDGDIFNSKGGADGQTDRVRNNTVGLDIVLRLAQTSKVNDKLSALKTIDEITLKGAVPFFLKDLNGKTLVTAVNCWIKKAPALVLGSEVNEREWTLKTGTKYEIFVGGND